ncbi:MAG: hypothetical protein U0412_00475 [Nitrospira sp.]
MADSPAQACVFNVKKRSWKAGIQVSVEIDNDQLTSLQHRILGSDAIVTALASLSPEDRAACEPRLPDLSAQAIAWCKLDLRLNAGLPPDTQRIASEELRNELEQAVRQREEYVVTYILTELDVTA